MKWVVELEVRYVPLPPEKRLRWLDSVEMLFACKPSSPPAQGGPATDLPGAGVTNPLDPPCSPSTSQSIGNETPDGLAQPTNRCRKEHCRKEHGLTG